MNYRHAFHAGNFADVLKHAVLALALARMTAKPKPLRVIDTHAGIGTYDLASPEAQRTGEWHSGIGQLIGPGAEPLPSSIATLLAPYLEAVRALNPPGDPIAYPGSPALSLALMRPDDRLVACELHPEDAGLLRQALARDRRAKVLQLDGWQALRSLLPPKERRGLILVDPPFEEPGDFERHLVGLADGVRRFATGTFMLWFPIKDRRQASSFEAGLVRMHLTKLLWIELATETPEAAEKLAATGVAVLNPPFGLAEQLGELLPFLAERLATGPGSSWSLRDLGAKTKPA
ncbi:MAG: 23S rRNA (adenine(2030)-N(6))-methyltransferase RlmJ [Proteobacteria bacterium]|nr:23S rRNA (adenine(2030)-N(6))-methyltransferase RlmJ [Pseudomonadota bacterium]